MDGIEISGPVTGAEVGIGTDTVDWADDDAAAPIRLNHSNGPLLKEAIVLLSDIT